MLISNFFQPEFKTLDNRCACHGSSDMTIINGRPVSQWVRYVKEPLLHNGYECRAQVKKCSPSSAMLTSPYGENFEWHDKLQTKKKHKKKKKNKST